jgi:GTP pyrophosphokinase
MNQVIENTHTEEKMPLTDEQLIQQEYELLLDEYRNSGHNLNFELIDKAFHFANNAHKGVRRRSGEPYMMHPLAVARIVIKEIGLGTTSICAALLHDVVEDTDYTVEDIRELFTPRIAIIVDGLTKIAGGVFGEQASTQAENFRKLLLTISEDVRVIMIKIADRLHNMRTLSSMPAAKQYKIAGETLYIYAPLAYRLGLFKIKTELEDLSFKYEHPEIFEQIKTRLEEGDSQREDIYTQFITPIQERLQSMGYDFHIEKRVKTIYSIWNKMKAKNIPFEEVYDLLAVRIIYKGKEDIDEKDQAWMIYSTVTNFYRPHPERIRDWVSTPKANGYEALHVTVMGPDGHWIEVQIRSERMHEIAEKGLSAHWKYKSGEQGAESELDNWLKTIKELLENPEPSAIDFLDTFKLNLFATEIFVFTPKGEIKTMPQGSTALDFAFSLHSDLGLHCIGAKVNHKLVPLSHVLDSGDQVEILTSKKQHPHSEWMNFVTTARAKTKLKSVFRKENRILSTKGKTILEEKFKELEISLDNQHIQLILKHFKLTHRNELYYELGKGIINLNDIEKKAFKKKSGFRWMNYWKLQFGTSNKKADETDENGIAAEAVDTGSAIKKIDRKKTLKLTDDTQGQVVYTIADCCNPIPGDDVLGYINEDETVTLHKRQCPIAAKLKSNFGERIVSAEWTSKKILSFPAILEVKGIDAQGVLIQIVKVISQDYEVNIQKINLETKGGIFEGRFHIFVHGTEDVNTLCMNILKIKAVNSVKRIEEELTQL